MNTNYANCLVTVIIKDRLVYLTGEYFTSVFSTYFSSALLSDFNIAMCMLKSLLGVKDMGSLFQGPYVLGFFPIGVQCGPLFLLSVILPSSLGFRC